MNPGKSLGRPDDKPAITFVARGVASRWPDIESIDSAALGREHGRLRSGIDTWIVQTYVRLAPRLRALGFPVSISEFFVRDTVCVAHRDDLNRYGDPLHDCYVVGVRADRPPVCVANIEIFQNGLDLPPQGRFMPFWPQPGLVPRDAARGDRVEQVAYLGRAGSVPRWYVDGRLESGLAAIGTRFEIREKAWNDYSGVDVLIAHHDESSTMLLNKPGSKLVNAWLAGVPAVLAPEPAYREMRRTALDYVEADGVEAVLAAVRVLRDDPGTYRAMVENGALRARDYDVDAVTDRWIRLLSVEASAGFGAWRESRPGVPIRYLVHLAAMSRQKLLAKAFRRRERSELRALGSRAQAPGAIASARSAR